jgi:multidrug efflux pump subunit AcrA (membrane-fusion protein)
LRVAPGDARFVSDRIAGSEEEPAVVELGRTGVRKILAALDERQRRGGLVVAPRCDERLRAEQRAQIAAILRGDQQQKFQEIIAESATRAPGAGSPRGRVFVPAPGSAPRMVSVRLGISDGTMTELSGGEFKEGDPVIVAAAQPGAPAQPSGPRLPF